MWIEGYLRANEIAGNDFLNVQRLLQAAMSSLKDCASIKGAVNAVPGAMMSMETLVKHLHNQYIPKPASSWLSGKYGVIVYLDDQAAREKLNKLAPGFFVALFSSLDMEQQVHILEGRIGTFSNCMLLTFRSLPGGNKAKHAANQVRKHLGAAEGCSRVTTEPFRLDKDHMPFSVNGNTRRTTMDKVLSPLMRQGLKKTLEARKRASGTAEEIGQLKCAFGDAPRDPRIVVLWVRKSEGEKGKTSIPRQLWSMLTCGAPPLMDLRLEDRVVVLVEYCSSAANPLSDRVVKDAVNADRQVDIVTANPDRFTRRPEEVAHAFRRPGDEWYTQGLCTTPSPAEWVKVNEREDDVKEQLRLGRQGADQASFYVRMTAVENRVNSAVENKTPSPQIDALKHFVREAMAHHGITTLLFAVRESPPGRSKLESRAHAVTLSRQDRFLNALLPVDVERRYVSLPSTTAYSDDVMIQQIKSELATISGKAMLVSASLDRIMRRRAHYDDLCASFMADGHMAMSFIWDTKMGVVDVAEAMRLRPEA